MTAALPWDSALLWAQLLIIRVGLDQIGIGVFGVMAIRLSQDPRPKVARFACIAGLCAQPFWFWTTYSHQQWAIFCLSFFYTWAWSRGLRTYWLKPGWFMRFTESVFFIQ